MSTYEAKNFFFSMALPKYRWDTLTNHYLLKCPEVIERRHREKAPSEKVRLQFEQQFIEWQKELHPITPEDALRDKMKNRIAFDGWSFWMSRFYSAQEKIKHKAKDWLIERLRRDHPNASEPALELASERAVNEFTWESILESYNNDQGQRMDSESTRTETSIDQQEGAAQEKNLKKPNQKKNNCKINQTITGNNLRRAPSN
jgi:hypothetical protein